MKKADKKVKEYLERADEVRLNVFREYSETIEKWVPHTIEIAKMIQKEEKK